MFCLANSFFSVLCSSESTGALVAFLANQTKSSLDLLKPVMLLAGQDILEMEMTFDRWPG